MNAPTAPDLLKLELLHGINLNHLLGFMAVAETGSFRAAALRMHISQSALSVKIRQLEQTVGVSVFHRTTRSVALTAHGQRLQATARRVSADLSQVLAELREESQLHRGVVTVAVLPSLASTVMPRAMKAFAKAHPGIDVRLRDADSKRAVELIRQGDADMGLLSRNDQLHELAFTQLFRDAFFAVVPAQGHALSARKRIALADLAGYPLLLNPRGVDLREVLQGMFSQAGITPRPAQELVGTHALVSLVAAGFGISVLPRMALAGLQGGPCHFIPLRGGEARDVGVMLPTRRSPSPACSAFKAFLEDNAQSLARAT